MNDTPVMPVIIGPTASGKTALAVALARRLNGAVISVDSRQVYRGMDIGTGKDLEEYGDVPRYLINIREAGEPYHVADYQRDFKKACREVLESGRLPVLCGGSGMYLQAALEDFGYTSVPVDEMLRAALSDKSREELLDIFRLHQQAIREQDSGIDPRYREGLAAYIARADTSTRRRLIRAIEIATWLRDHPLAVPEPRAIPNPLIIGIRLPVEERRRRITERLQERLGKGLVAEVEQLIARGVPEEMLIKYGLEYKFITLYLQGETDYQTMVTSLNTAIHRYAKRQMTWFRKMEREGYRIHWIDGCQPTRAQAQAAQEILDVRC